jgi:hypothetical protein
LLRFAQGARLKPKFTQAPCEIAGEPVQRADPSRRHQPDHLEEIGIIGMVTQRERGVGPHSVTAARIGGPAADHRRSRSVRLTEGDRQLAAERTDHHVTFWDGKFGRAVRRKGNSEFLVDAG